MKILLGFFIILVGAMIVIKSDLLVNNIGRVYTFEKYLGTEGGTRLGYKLIGIIIIAIGTMIMTGMINDFMNWMLAPIIKYSI